VRLRTYIIWRKAFLVRANERDTEERFSSFCWCRTSRQGKPPRIFRIADLITLWLRVGRMTCHFTTDVTAVTPDDRVRTMCVNVRSYISCEFGSAVSVRFGSVVRRSPSWEVHSLRHRALPRALNLRIPFHDRRTLRVYNMELPVSEPSNRTDGARTMQGNTIPEIVIFGEISNGSRKLRRASDIR